MKKIYKKPLLTFIIGAIIFGTTGVLAGTFIAKDVTYDNSKSSINADNVQDAIDALYTKANSGIPESYTGSYTYTPSTNTQTIYSANKRFNDNITINPIPSSYKNLTTNTTVNSSNLLDGVTAYDNNGELVTGSITTNCVGGTVTCSTCSTTSGQIIANFVPNYIQIYGKDGSVWWQFYYNKLIDSSNITVTSYTVPAGTTITFDKKFKIDNNNLVLHSVTTEWNNKTVYYMICK